MMKLKPTAILLSLSIGIAIQLQCFFGAIAAEEQEPGVPAESASAESVPSGVVPAKAVPPKAVPSESVPAENVPSESVPTKSVPLDSAPADSGTNDSGTTDSKSTDLAPTNSKSPRFASPDSTSSDVISPVVPPADLMGSVDSENVPQEISPQQNLPNQIFPNQIFPNQNFPQQPQGPVLQVETSPQPSNNESEKKGTLLGKIGKSLLQGGAKKNVPIAERPWWIPGNAFTDDSMVAPYHNLDIAWWDKRPMPNRPQWVRLSQSVTRYWKGSVTEPCFVLVAPMQQVPGNFTFRSRSFGGPRGWLQALNVPDKKGFPQYRYWLDQP